MTNAQLDRLLGMLDDVWGIEGLVDINVEDPAKDYPLVLGELIDMARRTKEAERKWDEVAGDAEHVAKMADAVDRVADLERQLATAHQLLADAAPLSWVCNPEMIAHAHEWEKRAAAFVAALDAPPSEPTPKPAKPYRLDYAAASGPCGGCSGMYLEGSEVAVMTHGDAPVMHVRCAERLTLDAPPSDSEEKC